MAACTLAQGTYLLKEVPDITDVQSMAELLRSMGLTVRNLENNQIEIASRSVSRIFSRENNLYIITDLGVIDYNEGSMIVPSSLYFNYKVTDLVFVDNYLLFLSTSRGLAIIDMETKELINYYDFSFLRNIYQMKYISEYLVLLTSKGLIKFNFNL